MKGPARPKKDSRPPFLTTLTKRTRDPDACAPVGGRQKVVDAKRMRGARLIAPFIEEKGGL